MKRISMAALALLLVLSFPLSVLAAEGSYIFTGTNDGVGYLGEVLPEGEYDVALVHISVDPVEEVFADSTVTVVYDDSGLCVCAFSEDHTFTLQALTSSTVLTFDGDDGLWSGYQMRFDAVGVLDPTESATEDSERLFLETPFEEYSVTEGFLLLIFVLILLSFVLSLFRG